MNEEHLQHVIKRTYITPSVETESAKLKPYLSSLDAEMDKILQDKKSTDYNNWLLYNDTLAKFTSVLKQQARPKLQVVYETDDSKKLNKLDYFVPTTRPRVERLLKFYDKINVSDNNEIIIPNRGLIPGSNFTNLIKDVLSAKKAGNRRDPLIGEAELIDYMTSEGPIVPS